MIKAIIIDDEPNNVALLDLLLKKYCTNVNLLRTAESAAEGKTQIASLNPDLVFLDIEMPFCNGFDLLKSLAKIDFEIIFITAFDKYAIDAFRFAALDYLLKPINIEQLVNAVNRAAKRLSEKTSSQNYELLIQNFSKKELEQKSISLTENGQQHFIQLAEIKYIIAHGSYTHIYTTKRIFIATKNLVDFEELLPANIFCRIHNGHIVNKTHIVKIKNGRGGAVLLNDGTQLEIAVRRKGDFLKLMNGQK